MAKSKIQVSVQPGHVVFTDDGAQLAPFETYSVVQTDHIDSLIAEGHLVVIEDADASEKSTARTKPVRTSDDASGDN